MDLLQPMMIAALLVGGMGVAILGSLKIPLARRLNIDEARVGGMVSMFGFIIMPVILVAGFFTDLAGGGEGGFGKQAVLMAGCAGFAASLLLLGRASSYGIALVAVVLLSASWATVINVGNVLTLPAFGSPGREPAFAFNLANVFFGLGAFFTPLIVAQLLQRMPFPVTLSILGASAVVPAILAIGVQLPPLEAAGADPGLGVVLGSEMLWLCGMGLFFYGPLEASMAAWTTTLLGDRGVSEKAAAAGLSGFWLAFLAGRLATALTLPPGYGRVLILTLAAVAVVLLVGIVLSRTKETSLVLVIALGFCLGPIFPTLMSVLLGPHFPREVHGRAVGFFFAIGGIGWTAIPMLIGGYARKVGVQRSFIIGVGAAVCLSGVSLILVTFPSP